MQHFYWLQTPSLISVTMRNYINHGSTRRASAPKSRGHGFDTHLGQDFFTRLCPLRHMRSMRNYPISASVERATPIPHSLTTE